MYLEMVRIGEKVMESCWYSLCVYKNKRKKKEKEKRHKSKFTLWKEKIWKVEKKMHTKEVHNEVSSSQD